MTETDNEYSTFEVRDGVRRLRFQGELLARSSSHAPGKSRWIEFALYRTKSGQYVVERIGHSYVYHTRNCPIVIKNRLSQYPEEHLPRPYQPCTDCKPKPAPFELDGHYNETPRYFAIHSDTVEGVLAIISQRDKSGIEYLTNVAKDLMYQASRVDETIREEFMNTRID